MDGSVVGTMLIRHAEQQLARLLAYVTGLVNRRLLLQWEYLAAENCMLRTHLPGSALRLRAAHPLSLVGVGGLFSDYAKVPLL